MSGSDAWEESVADWELQCTAVDRDNMKAVLNNVQDIILRTNIEAAVSPPLTAVMKSPY